MAFRDQVSSIVREILADSTQWPAEMSYAIPQLMAQNPVATTRPGDLISSAYVTASVTATGVTFAAGTDILSTPLSFTAQGNNDYLLAVSADCWFNSGTNNNALAVNLDGSADATISQYTGTAKTGLYGAAVIVKPSTGNHTVNARLYVAAGTGTIQGGTGGAAGDSPILVALYRI